jgi:hypothetical protein
MIEYSLALLVERLVLKRKQKKRILRPKKQVFTERRNKNIFKNANRCSVSLEPFDSTVQTL